MADPLDQPTRPSPDQERRRRQRNVALALALLLLVVLFYVLTFVKGPGVASQGF